LNRSIREGRIALLLTLMVISLGLWIICAKLVVPPVIESAYRGESWSFLNRMIRGQATHPVSEYLQDWDAVTIPVLLAGLGFWLVLLVISRLRPWRASLVAAAAYPVLVLQAKFFQAGFFLMLFFAAFCYFYRKQYWQEPEARRVFWWTVSLLAAVVAAKVAVYYFVGYVPDRMFFYGFLSPKFGGFLWVLPITLSLWLLWRWRLRLQAWPARRFLASLWLIGTLFSVGVAGLREGASSIAEPFTRSDLEYAGDMPLIQSIPQFLHDYAALNPKLSDHGKTHPPGYAVLLYIFHTAFRADLLVLALLVTALGDLFVFPVYYFWKEFVPEEALRSLFPAFIVTPSLVMFSATSMDIVSVVTFWLALAVSYLGWKREAMLSFLGGILAGVALLMNFLFLAFGLVFAFFMTVLLRGARAMERRAVLKRAALSLLGFLGFFAALYTSTGYSIVANFFAAHSVHGGGVASRASSPIIYLVFALINVVAFFLYLGIPNGILLLRQGFRPLLAREQLPALLGFGMVILFLLSGLFQGEVERIWLFLVPLFVPALCRALPKNELDCGAVISLLILQIVTIQTLFYTYW
jgi:hypothetical protein